MSDQERDYAAEARVNAEEEKRRFAEDLQKLIAERDEARALAGDLHQVCMRLEEIRAQVREWREALAWREPGVKVLADIADELLEVIVADRREWGEWLKEFDSV